MILNDEQYKAIWDRVDKELHFLPNYSERDSSFHIPPFHINGHYVVYDIENATDEMETIISNAFINCTKPGERIYALDWQHSAFLYDPRNPEEQESCFVEDERYFGGGYNAYFPDFYPDGDYYFFIAEDFRFGYLTHPWRKEAWVFGDDLIKEFEGFYKSMGWKKTEVSNTMIPRPKYIENILSVTKEKRGEIECDVVCECGARHFIGYKNDIVRSAEEAAYEAAYNAFNEKYGRIRFGEENGISYLYGMKGLFGEDILAKFAYKPLDSTQIVMIKCAVCGKEYVLFDSRFHGYDAVIPERESEYDDRVYPFEPIKWRGDKDGIATITVRIQNDDSLDEFIENAYETDEKTYSKSFGWITIKAVNIKTKAQKTILDMETQ